MEDDEELLKRVLKEEAEAQKRAAAEAIPGLPERERREIAEGVHTADPIELAGEIERRGG